jgi:fatty-acyl-CoA synthase
MSNPSIEPTPWVDGLTVGEVLRATAARYPDHDAIVFPSLGVRWNWAELDRRVDRLASGLIRIGVRQGEHVGIWSMNCPEWVLFQFAAARAGAVMVNINPAYRLHELEVALRNADVATLVVGRSFKTSNFVEMVETIGQEIRRNPGSWRVASLPLLRRVVAMGDKLGAGWISWDSLAESDINSAALAERARQTKATDPFNIQFTSGTTGLPKGATLTHRNMLMNAFYIGQRVRYTEADRVCVPVPFYHCFGCILGTTVCSVYGSALVVPAPTFDALATLRAIAEERCTAIYGVPMMFTSQLDHPERSNFDLSSLRTGIMAGSPCPLPLMKRVMDDMGASQITIGYGLTEASPIITQTSVDDSIDVRVSTVGRPIPGIEVKLVDREGRVVAPGEAGEMCVRGHNVMVGYYNDPAATARVLEPDGWLHSGDLALLRDDGNYRIVGRVKEIIIRGGENIYPPEVENYLCHHPSIAEVAVVGLPDRVYGEVVSAWVVTRPGASITTEELQEFCKGKIAHFKIPRYVEVVDSFPRTVTGKVRKHELRDWGIERFGLADVSNIPTA